jgi:hypothetical protein
LTKEVHQQHQQNRKDPKEEDLAAVGRNEHESVRPRVMAQLFACCPRSWLLTEVSMGMQSSLKKMAECQYAYKLSKSSNM